MLPHILALTLAAGLAHAQPPSPATPQQASNLPNAAQLADPTNAALAYWRAWSVEPAEDVKAFQTLYSATDNLAIDPASPLAASIRKLAEPIDRIFVATSLPECDFGIMYSDGWKALLPHLSKLRSSARLLAAEASLARAEGRHDDAAARVSAIFRISRHLTNERVLISSLVSAAICGLGHAQVTHAAESGAFSREQAASLLRELDRFSLTDPFGVRASLRSEGDMIAYWIDANVKGPHAGADLADKLDAAGVADPNHDLAAVRALSEDALRAAARQVREAYALYLDAFDAPDAEKQIGDIERDVAAGKHGPLTQVLGASVTMLLAGDRKSVAYLEEARRILRAVK